MKTLKFDFNDFLSLFDLKKQTTFEEFCAQLSILNISDKTGTFAIRSNLDDFLERVSKKDNRKSRVELYKKNLYRILVTDAEAALKEWFRRYGELPEKIDFYYQMPNTEILSGDTFQGRTLSKYGRICKNINFVDFYNTKKLYINDSEYCFGLMKVMFEDFKIRNSLASPAFFDHICNIKEDYGQFWLDFMTGANRASIFNPVTYRGILTELFQGETLFAPCMGWNSYQLAFYNSNWKHFISTDVIPNVVENGRLLHQEYQRLSSDGLFELQDKQVDLYLCPSQKLKENYQFDKKYQNSVDAVLFSPPYFDLELYGSDNQSVTDFPDYQEWLRGYWNATIELCTEVLKPGGRLGFVISNYRNKQKKDVNISQDMSDVVLKHLDFKGKYKVQWSAISNTRQAKKTRGGNYEDLWLFEKK